MRRGFTLIELLISITIFVVFIGVAGTSYVHSARSLRDANALRKTVAEARGFLETITQDIRAHAVDYACFTSDCLSYVSTGHAARLLPLVNREGDRRVVYRFRDGVMEVCRSRKTTAWESCGFSPIVLPSFSLTHAQFLITPSADPFAAAAASDDAVQFQPSVTMLLSGLRAPHRATDAPLHFQTTISSRLYFPQRTP